ncbi:MAG TPA: hypothetical protein VJT31_01470 [Rugosimonospora sp.]|nr:hypothetical protein [Rugosimonospora sp.]
MDAAQIYAVDANNTACNQGTGPTTSLFHVLVSDANDTPGSLTVTVMLSAGQVNLSSSPVTATYDGKYYSVALGPVSEASMPAYRNSVEAIVTAADKAGNKATPVHLYRLSDVVDCARG